jgi:hypothetical protein
MVVAAEVSHVGLEVLRVDRVAVDERMALADGRLGLDHAVVGEGQQCVPVAGPQETKKTGTAGGRERYVFEEGRHGEEEATGS